MSGIIPYIPLCGQTTDEVIIHEVKRGETLYSISRKYGVRIPDISESNPDITGSNIKLGQKLRVPRKGAKQEDLLVEEKTQTEMEVVISTNNVQEVENNDNPNVQLLNDNSKIVAENVLSENNGALTYTVEKGDTLTSISRKTRVSLKDLLSFNEGVSPSRLKIGQKLKLSNDSQNKETKPTEEKEDASLIAQKTPAQKESLTLYLAPILKELESIPVQKRRWKNVVIHHSATTEGNARYFDYYHRKVKGWENGLAYHFVIGNGVDSGDGQIEIGPRWKKQIKGGHVRGDELNEVSIGICFVGNFEKNKPSRAQFIAVVELLRYLNRICGNPVPILWLHREINPRHTACPGRLFPVRELRDILKASPE